MYTDGQRHTAPRRLAERTFRAPALCIHTAGGSEKVERAEDRDKTGIEILIWAQMASFL